MTVARQSLGRRAEDLVAARLRERGCAVLERNARPAAVRGEIDIVALDRGVVVFVEVKAIREGNLAGPEDPVAMVGRRKRQKLRSLAAAWIRENAPRAPGGMRFDVVGVTIAADGSVARWNHLEGAF